MFCCEWPVLYVSLYGDEWKNRSSGIYYLKSLKPWSTQIYRYTPWNSILSGKAWNYGGDSQIKFFYTKHPLDPFPWRLIPPIQSIHPAKSIFWKETKQNLRPSNCQYWNQMTKKLARYIYSLVSQAVWLINSPLSLFFFSVILKKCLKWWKRKGNVKGEFDGPNSLVYKAGQIEGW